MTVRELRIEEWDEFPEPGNDALPEKAKKKRPAPVPKLKPVVKPVVTSVVTFGLALLRLLQSPEEAPPAKDTNETSSSTGSYCGKNARDHAGDLPQLCSLSPVVPLPNNLTREPGRSSSPEDQSRTRGPTVSTPVRNHLFTISSGLPEKKHVEAMGEEDSRPAPQSTMASYHQTQPGFSGFWFRMPEELGREQVQGLKPAQLKVYMAIQRSIQRDRRPGEISNRRLAQSIGLSLDHVNEAIKFLCQQGFVEADKRPGQTTKYRNGFDWKSKRDCSPTGEHLHEPKTGNKGSDCSPTDEHPNCSPTGKRDCSPTGEQHLESLEAEGGLKLETSSSSSKVIKRERPSEKKPPENLHLNSIEHDDDPAKPAEGKTHTSPREELRALVRESTGTDATRRDLNQIEGLAGDQQVYASPEDELIALIATTTGRRPDRRLVREIRSALETRGATLRDYLDDIRPRIPRLTKPRGPGFFLDQARGGNTPEREPQPAMSEEDRTRLAAEIRLGAARASGQLIGGRIIEHCNNCHGLGKVGEKYCDCQHGKSRYEHDQQARARQQGVSPAPVAVGGG